MNPEKIELHELLTTLQPKTSEIIKREMISDDLIPYDFTDWKPLNEENVKDVKNVPGVYEICANLKKDNKHVVAYIGCTDNLTQRILTHCAGFRTTSIGTTRRSNIICPIQYAKERSWEIMFRVCILELSEAKCAESEMLKTYDFAWNIKDNHKNLRRKIY